MIKLHYETEPIERFKFDGTPALEYDAVIRGDSLDSVLDGVEGFLRAVYGWIPVDEHLNFVGGDE